MAPGDPLKTDREQALFTAGELAAFTAGHRGVALVQLFNGWDRSKGQPMYSPFALEMLARALAAPGVAARASVAPGGAGLTAIVYADREPFASWAAHLASFGCQVRGPRAHGRRRRGPGSRATPCRRGCGRARLGLPVGGRRHSTSHPHAKHHHRAAAARPPAGQPCGGICLLQAADRPAVGLQAGERGGLRRVIGRARDAAAEAAGEAAARRAGRAPPASTPPARAAGEGVCAAVGAPPNRMPRVLVSPPAPRWTRTSASSARPSPSCHGARATPLCRRQPRRRPPRPRPRARRRAAARRRPAARGLARPRRARGASGAAGGGGGA